MTFYQPIRFFSSFKGSVLLSFLLLSFLLIGRTEAQPIISIGSETACAGSVITVPITVQNFYDVGAVSLEIQFPAANISYSGFNSSALSGSLIVNNPSVGGVPQGRVLVSWFSLTPVNIGSGLLMNLTFLVPINATFTSVPLTFNLAVAGQCELADGDAEVILNTVFNNGGINRRAGPTISSQPNVNLSVSDRGNVSLPVVVVGTGLSYQWEVLSTGSTSWQSVSGSIYSGDTTPSLSISRASAAINNYQYRLRINWGCGPPTYAGPYTLTVQPSVVSVTLGGISGICAQSIVAMPIVVENFVNIGAVSQTIQYNPDSLRYLGFTFNNTALSGNLIVNSPFPGRILTSWYSLSPLNIVSGEYLQIEFEVLLPGSATVYWDTTESWYNEIADVLTGEIVPIDFFHNGTISAIPNSIQPQLFTADSLFHCGDSLVLDAGTGYSRYEWSSGDTTQSKAVRSTGWHRVRVYDGVCSVEDSVFVSLINIPRDTVICSGSSTLLSVPDIRIPSVVWSTGDTTSSITVSPTQTTTYYVTVSNGIHSCVDSLTVTVTDALRIADQFVCIGDTTEIPVLVTKLDDIAAISMAVAFDSTTMDFVGYAHLHPALQSAQIGSLGNQIRLGWFGIEPINLSNDTLVRLRFVFSGSGSVVFDTSDPANCEIVNDVLDIVPFCFEGGSMSPADPVQIISSPTGPFVFYEHDTVELSVQSIGARVHEWQWFNSNSGQWQSAAGIPGYSGVGSSRIVIEDIAYSRPQTRLRLRLNNGCSDVFSPEFVLEVQQRLRVEAMPAVGCSGDTLEIPVRIWGARELGAITMSLLSLPQSLTYAEWVRVHPSTQAAGWQMAMLNGDIRCAWFSTQSASIADGDTLGVFRLVALSGTPLIWDVQNPGHNEYADADGNLIECSYLNASIATLALPQPQLMASNMAFCPGGSSALWVQEIGGQGQNGWVYEWLRDGQLVFTSNSDSAYVVSVPGLYRVQVTAPNGCRAWTDSLFITASQISSTTLNPVICAPTTFVSGGQTFSSSGTYQLTLVNAVGCDSLITIHLIVNEPSDSTLSVAICSPSSYAFNGQNYSATGVYSATLTNAEGCDSVVILNLTVNQPVSTQLNETICAPLCYQVGGQDFCASGQYTITLTSSLGCDSVVQLGLTVQNCNRINGVLRYKNAALTPMSRSSVNLLTQARVIVATDSTNALGQFQLNGYPSGNYILSGQSSLNWGGVNATDAILIARSYNLITPLTGLNLLAADVNTSGTVNVTDAIILTRRYSFNLLSLPSGNWCFENLSINATGQPLQQNLMALCFGDVNGSNALMGQRLGSGLSWGDYRSDLVNERGSLLRFPIYLSGISRMGAMSLAIQLPEGVQLLNARNLMSNGNFSFGQEGSEMRMAWFDVDGFGIHADQPIMEWELSCQDCDWGDVLNRMKILEHSELADELGAVRIGAQLHRPFYSKSIDGQPTRMNVYPNPGSGMFHVNGPAIHLRIRDVSGKELVQLPASGFDTKVNLQHLSDGVYMLEVETLAGMEYHRLVVKK